MKNSTRYLIASLLSLFLLTGFTCSKHVPVNVPDQATNKETSKDTESALQDQMTEQTPPPGQALPPSESNPNNN